MHAIKGRYRDGKIILAEKADWPDRLGRGRFKFGWDAEKRRGVVTCRYIHLVPPGASREKELGRFKAALELQWDYYGPFGFAAVLAEANEPMYAIDKKVDASNAAAINLR